MPLNCPLHTPKIVLICLRQAAAAFEKTDLTRPHPSLIMESGGGMFGSQWVTSEELRFPVCKMDTDNNNCGAAGIGGCGFIWKNMVRPNEVGA